MAGNMPAIVAIAPVMSVTTKREDRGANAGNARPAR
jgi:hypothetical protein